MCQNPNTNGEEALERFKSHVETSIHRHLDVSKSKISAIDLDSSNEHKFSHHLIFDIQGFAFKNNYAVGSFVRKILSDISGDLESTVAVKTKDGITSTFVDSGVYTKNRNFRMFLCSKFGKTSVLKCQTSSSDSAKTIFLSSLVTYFCHSRKLINFGTEVVSKSDQADLVLAFKKPRLDTKATSTSIFPEIDQFICDLILPGTIRKIIWKPNESTLEYETQGYRFCENIQRCHKSNNVKLVVLLSKGVYFQVKGLKGRLTFQKWNFASPFRFVMILIARDLRVRTNKFQWTANRGFSFLKRTKKKTTLTMEKIPFSWLRLNRQNWKPYFQMKIAFCSLSSFCHSEN